MTKIQEDEAVKNKEQELHSLHLDNMIEELHIDADWIEKNVLPWEQEELL